MIPSCLVEHLAALTGEARSAALIWAANRIHRVMTAAGADRGEVDRVVAELCERLSEASR